jgi:hypothetical protein
MRRNHAITDSNERSKDRSLGKDAAISIGALRVVERFVSRHRSCNEPCSTRAGVAFHLSDEAVKPAAAQGYKQVENIHRRVDDAHYKFLMSSQDVALAMTAI